MSELLIPVAIDCETRLAVRPFEAQAGRDECPECASSVVWRRPSPGRRPHFAHLPDHDGGCSGESALHKGAKWLIDRHLTEWMAGAGRAPVSTFRCECGQQWVTPWAMRAAVRAAKVEHRLGSGRVPDVFVESSEGDGAIEVLQSHAVDEDKAAAYLDTGLWWIEVRAESVVADPNEPWEVVWGAGLAPPWAVRCAACLERLTSEHLESVASLSRRESTLATGMREVADARLKARPWLRQLEADRESLAEERARFEAKREAASPEMAAAERRYAEAVSGLLALEARERALAKGEADLAAAGEPFPTRCKKTRSGLPAGIRCD